MLVTKLNFIVQTSPSLLLSCRRTHSPPPQCTPGDPATLSQREKPLPELLMPLISCPLPRASRLLIRARGSQGRNRICRWITVRLSLRRHSILRAASPLIGRTKPAFANTDLREGNFIAKSRGVPGDIISYWTRLCQTETKSFI